MQQGDTISAIATGTGIGGIGIIRLSGEKAIATAEKVFRAKNGQNLADAQSHKALYGNVIRNNGEVIDEVLCLVMRSPFSYTKEDVVEIQCHGGSMVLREILALTYECGARPAEPGEFTKRAFLNGRLDLSQAQAVMDIIEAKTESTLNMAAGHLTGLFSERIKSLRLPILEMIAHLEATIDFPEEDIDDVVLDQVQGRLKDLQAETAKLLKTAHTGRILQDGLMTAIVGRPNVGKSSLLNALLREERAIVTDIPGTTRDSIEEFLNLGGVPLRIIDTAGIRTTDDEVEKLGVAKARTYVQQAALVLALFDGSQPLTADDEEIIKLLRGRDCLILLNKCDLPNAFDRSVFLNKFSVDRIVDISAATGQGLDCLTEIIVNKVYGGEVRGSEQVFVNNAREAELLRKAGEHLQEASQSIDNGMSPDFVVIDLRSAWEKLGEITGETVEDDIVDQIFTRFCIGK